MAIQFNAVVACNRFGLGARAGDLLKVNENPRQWLRQQIENPELPTATPTGSRKALVAFLELREANRLKRKQGVVPADLMKLGKKMRPIYLEHVMARSIHAVQTSTPFYERLVHFWSNHFAVSADKAQMYGLVGSLETEAIRPHVNDKFSNMLRAVEQHPAMLTYLNNYQSVGPNSELAEQVARKQLQRKIGINENLAREILELHTLGVDGGYSQQDVTTFARVISGWTYGGSHRKRLDVGVRGEFAFNSKLHEPGPKTMLGKTYRQIGLSQGEAVLDDLASSSSTANFLATKLVRHFIDDNPPARAVGILREAYLESGGYLPAVYSALIDLDEAWSRPFTKYKSPREYVYSIFRAVNFVPEKPGQVFGPLVVLGQSPFQPGSPAGWPDTAQAWSGGEALFKRIEFAVTVADKIGNRVDPLTLSGAIIGPLLSDHSRLGIERASSGAQGLALLFTSPEFMRR